MRVLLCIVVSEVVGGRAGIAANSGQTKIELTIGRAQSLFFPLYSPSLMMMMMMMIMGLEILSFTSNSSAVVSRRNVAVVYNSSHSLCEQGGGSVS